MTITFPLKDYSGAEPARPPRWYYDEVRRLARDGVTRNRSPSPHAVQITLHLVEGVRRRRRLFDREVARRMRAEGHSYRTIARACRVTKTSIIKALRATS